MPAVGQRVVSRVARQGLRPCSKPRGDDVQVRRREAGDVDRDERHGRVVLVDAVTAGGDVSCHRVDDAADGRPLPFVAIRVAYLPVVDVGIRQSRHVDAAGDPPPLRMRDVQDHRRHSASSRNCSPITRSTMSRGRRRVGSWGHRAPRRRWADRGAVTGLAADGRAVANHGRPERSAATKDVSSRMSCRACWRREGLRDHIDMIAMRVVPTAISSRGRAVRISTTTAAQGGSGGFVICQSSCAWRRLAPVRSFLTACRRGRAFDASRSRLEAMGDDYGTEGACVASWWSTLSTAWSTYRSDDQTGRLQMVRKGVQAVAVKRAKIPRSRHDRLRTRLLRLQRISESNPPGADQVSKAVAALRALHSGSAHRPMQIKVRSTFITRRELSQGEMSDRRPPQDPCSPTHELVSPRGIAQQLELVALFVAQTVGERRQDGRVATLGLELEPRHSNEVAWIDVIVPHAEHTPEAVYAANLRDNRLRQVKRALDTLALKELIELPNSRSARGKYDDFRLLDEGGPRVVGQQLSYRLPLADEPVIDVPLNFFLNGWVHVLSKSEITLWLMLRDLERNVRMADQTGHISIVGRERQRRYGVTKDAYKGWWLLERAGLVAVEADPGRRGDGTVVGFDPNDPPALHRFRMLDDGLDQPAAPAVKAALAAVLDGEQVGVARVNADQISHLLGL